MLDLAPIKERCEKARAILALKRGHPITASTFAVALVDTTNDIPALIEEVERLRAMLADADHEFEEIKAELY